MSLLKSIVDTVTFAPEPTAEMKAVLDALASLNPKPIAQCTAEEARRQPLPGDGVKKLLEERGHPH